MDTHRLCEHTGTHTLTHKHIQIYLERHTCRHRHIQKFITDTYTLGQICTQKKNRHIWVYGRRSTFTGMRQVNRPKGLAINPAVKGRMFDSGSHGPQ